MKGGSSLLPKLRNLLNDLSLSRVVGERSVSVEAVSAKSRRAYRSEHAGISSDNQVENT